MNSNQARRQFWTPMRLALTVVVLSLVAMGGVSSCTSSDETPERASNQPGASPRSNAPVPPPGVKPAPPANASLPATVLSAKLQTVNGGTISLGDYSGKVMLVNLWATWCGPCRSEIPELVKLHKEFQSQGFEIVGLSTENPTSSAESVKNFVQSFQIDYHVGWASPEVAISFMQMTQRDAIPQSFIIS